MFEPTRTIARITKAHGRRGEVVVEPTAGLPPLLREGLEVFVAPPLARGPRWLQLSSVSGEPSQRVSFVGLDDRESAETLVGKQLMVREADLGEDFARIDTYSLIGRDVIDTCLGALGTIEEIMRGPAQDVWVVRGSHGEVLIPAVDEIVLENGSTGPISVRVPKGLVEGKEVSFDAI